MPGGERQPVRAPRGGIALGFALAALAASWNPIAAPFGLVVGIAAAWLGARALRGGGQRWLPAAAVGLGVLAALASVAILVLTAEAVSVDLPGEPIVKGRTQAELEQTLEEAGERTRMRRERAAGELDRLAGKRPDGGPGPQPDKARSDSGVGGGGGDPP